MKRAWGNTTDRILELLQDEPLTKSEICEQLDLTHDQVAAVLSRLRKKTRTFDQRIYVSSYTRDMLGQKQHIRARYALGKKRDAAKPDPIPAKERNLKSYYARVARLRNRSIFSQTTSARQLLGRQ